MLMLGRQTRALRLSRDHGLPSHRCSYRCKLVHVFLQIASKLHIFQAQAPSFIGMPDLRQPFGYKIFRIEVFRVKKWVLWVRNALETDP